LLTFENPQNIFLLLLIPLSWILFHIFRFRGGTLFFSYVPWNQRQDFLSSTWLEVLLFFERLVFWLGMAMLILALAGPARVVRHEQYANRGMDIMIVLDTSPSMAAMDFGVQNRLETAKSMIRPFMETRENDSFGLVSFSSEAALLVPPTVDYSLFKEQLSELSIGAMDKGTAIGMGLALGILHLSSSSAQGKVILLMTDGENNAGEIQPSTAVSMARQLGITIYTIGIGSEGEAAVEFLDPESGKIISGRLNSRFDEELLKGIARDTGGRYYRAISTGTLSNIFRNIDSRESGERLTRLTVEKLMLHRWFIMLGFIMILFSLFIRRVLLQEVL